MLFGGHQFFAKRSTVFHEEQFNRKENSSLVRYHCFPRAFRMINTKKRVKWNQANAVRLTWIICVFITSHNFCTIWIVGLIYYTKSPSLIALSFLVFFFSVTLLNARYLIKYIISCWRFFQVTFVLRIDHFIPRLQCTCRAFHTSSFFVTIGPRRTKAAVIALVTRRTTNTR